MECLTIEHTLDIYFHVSLFQVTTEDMGTAPPIETGEAVGPTLGDILRKSKTKSNLQKKSLYLTEGFFYFFNGN